MKFFDTALRICCKILYRVGSEKLRSGFTRRVSFLFYQQFRTAGYAVHRYLYDIVAGTDFYRIGCVG